MCYSLKTPQTTKEKIVKTLRQAYEDAGLDITQDGRQGFIEYLEAAEERIAKELAEKRN